MPNTKNAQAELLAKNFSNILKSWLSATEFDELLYLTKEEKDPTICHSHDFCDANMAMAEAWEATLKKEFPFDDPAAYQLLQSAWDLAKKNYFFMEMQIAE